MSNLSDKTLAVAALARNCAVALQRSIPKIERLRSYFASSIVVVVENDSTDNTRSLLDSWELNAGNVVILDGKQPDMSARNPEKNTANLYNPSGGFQRIERMVALRNTYMDYLARLNMQIDYLMVTDIDIDDFSEISIINAIQNVPYDWTALFANGVKYFNFFGRKIKTRYYDEYAIVPYSSDVNSRIEMSFDELKTNREKLEMMLKTKDFVKCFSAFGGIGIYQYQYMKNLRYFTESNTKNRYFAAVCEHISVNLSLRQYGANYVARDLFVFHTRLKKIKDILLEFLPAALWIFLYDLFRGVSRK
jgi:glycosyltransferase involved in cell wall biosynthesis